MPQTIENSRMTQTNLKIVGSARFFSSLLVISLDRVNHVHERLPAGERIGYPLGFLGPERHWRFEKEYEKLFPDRTLRRKERRLWLLGALALISLAIAIGPLL